MDLLIRLLVAVVVAAVILWLLPLAPLVEGVIALLAFLLIFSGRVP